MNSIQGIPLNRKGSIHSLSSNQQHPNFIDQTHSQKSNSNKGSHINSAHGQSFNRKLIETPINPIDILSDQEQESIIGEKFQSEMLRAKIQQAKMTKSRQNILKVLYVQLNFKGRNQKEKEKKYTSMIKGYISNNLKTANNEPFDIRNSHFNPRLNINPDTSEFIECEYILYGCDLLSHNGIKKLFLPLEPTIKWIDSSTCRLTFLNKTGWSAIVNSCNSQNLRKQTEKSVKMQNLMKGLRIQQGEQQMQEQEDQNNKDFDEQWMKIKKFRDEYRLVKNYVQLNPYYELGFKRRLMIRNCTSEQQKLGYNLDIDPPQAKENISADRISQDNLSGAQNINESHSKCTLDYKKYLKVKQSLYNDIENSNLVKPEYVKIMKQMENQYSLMKFRNYNSATNNRQGFQGQFQKYPNGQRGNYQGGYNRYGGNNQGENQTQRPYGSFNNYQVYGSRYPRGNGNYNQYNNAGQQYSNNNFRNRSRDNGGYQRQRRGGGYQNREGGYQRGGYDQRGSSGRFSRGGNKHKQWDAIQNNFDSYVEQRDGLSVIRNPQKYLEPAFVDKDTGMTFYANPLYDSNIARQYMQGDQGNSAKYSNNSSNYEYTGNNGGNNNYYQGANYNQRGGYNRQGGYSTHGFNQGNRDYATIEQQPYRANYDNRQQMFPKNPVQQSSEQQFNAYVSQKNQQTQNAFSKTKTTNPIIQPVQKTNSQAQVPPLISNPVNIHPNLQGELADYSIISQQKHDNRVGQKDFNDANLENILDGLNQQQSHGQGFCPNYFMNDDSQDLEFMIQQRQRHSAAEKKVQGVASTINQKVQGVASSVNQNPVVKTEYDHNQFKNRAEPSSHVNYIEESIKIEHIPKWMKYQHTLIQDSAQYSNTAQGNQSMNMGQCSNQNSQKKSTASQVVQNSVNEREASLTSGDVKKKIPKKKRDASKSLSKRN